MRMEFPRLIPLLFVVVFIASSHQSFGQNIDQVIGKYANDYPQERVYIHYDKASYAAGEIVWFKAYVMEGILPAESSKTLYVDWVDENGSLILHTVAPLVDATTNGQFEIPPAYKGGFIHVRAYTKWMLNFDTAFLYHKNIPLLARANSSPKKTMSSPTLHFFPEGGDAVAGIESKIAFKAVDQFGLPAKIQGIIRNSAGIAIDSFRSVHDGMGYFYLFPEPGMNYSSQWKDEKGTQFTTPLPAIKQTGIVLQVTGTGKTRQFVIKSQEDAPPNSTYFVMGTMHQHQIFKTSRMLAKDNAGGTIPVNMLPTGILTITVFDAHWNALAERITFINNSEYGFEPVMTVQHWGLNKRARNEIEIVVPDSLNANLSITVTDVAIDLDSSNNIISELLLGSELKGDVFNPAYYFRSPTETTFNYLDLVMLTNGWRRFKWEDVVAARYPVLKYQRDTSWLSLGGKVMGASPAQLSGAGEIALVLKENDSSMRMLLLPINSDGIFNDPSTIFFDTARVYYQLDKKKGLGNATVNFMHNRAPVINYKSPKNFQPLPDTTGQYRHFSLASEMWSLQEAFKGKVLENVTVTAKTKTPLEVMDEKYSTGFFKGSDSYQFDLLNDITAAARIDIFSYLQGKVPGLQIRSGAGDVSLEWRGTTPTLFLDEMNVDADMLSNVPVTDVAYIKVFRPPFMGAPGGGSGGAIAVYTRRGDDVKKSGRGLDKNTIAGYTPIREFYAPNYDRFDRQHELPDLRTTLYWNPQVITSPGKNSVILRFYNNDVTKAFRVVIEGITKDGRLAHIEQIME